MAFIAKTNWVLDEIVLPEDINRIESGVEFNDEQITNNIINIEKNTSDIGVITQEIGNKSNKAKDYSTTILASDWSTTAPYTMTLLGITGLTANDKPFIGVALSADTQLAISQLASWGMVSKAQTSANSITFTCLESKPTVDIPIQIKVVY